MNKKYYIYVMILLTALCGHACTGMEEEGIVHTGPETSVHIKYAVAEDWQANARGSEMTTKATGVSVLDEDTVDNVWVFQFDGTQDGSLLASPPRYIEQSQLSDPLVLVNKGSTTQRVVVVANTHNSLYQWGLTAGSSTYQDLKKVVQLISAETELYPSKHLPMVGQATFSTNVSTSRTIPLTRNVARIELTLSSVSSIEVDSVQLCNVPAQMEMLSGVLARTAVWPTEGTCRLIHYPAVSAGAGGAASSMFWYMPQNLQGTHTNPTGNPKVKNVYAPKTATYIKILARDASTKEPITYTFYPGGNTTDNFDLICNNSYKLTINLLGKTDAEIDSRIDVGGVVSFAGKPANSYILNPSRTETAVNYRIYPSQVDLFWGPKYGNVPSNQLKNNVPWTIELLWMDERFLVTPSGGSDGNIKLSKTTGTGVQDYFEISVPKTAKKGSFVVYIYKTSDASKTPLWSWHLWVTDYNPDESKKMAPISKQYVYPVPGGAVHRYDNVHWNTGPYKNSFIMDRNLGQREAYPAEFSIPSYNVKGFFYYQFGRKDPFPVTIENDPSYRIYNINNTPLTYYQFNTLQGGSGSSVTPADAVTHPLNFYLGYQNTSGWTSNSYSVGKGAPLNSNDPPYYDYLWFDPSTKLLSDNRYSMKSLYDPCPPGWKLPPTFNIWDGFVLAQTVANANRPGLGWSLNGWQGLRYWPMESVEGSYPVQGQIYYPITGYVQGYYTSSAYLNYTSYAMVWSASGSAIWGNGLFASQSILRQSGYSTYTHDSSNAQPVRCMSEQ